MSELADVPPNVAKISTLARECARAGEPTVRVYIIVPGDGPYGPASLLRAGGHPIGVDEETRPRWEDPYDDETPEKFMHHLVTLDLDEVPELRVVPKLAHARAIALFITDAQENEAFTPTTKETVLVVLTDEDVEKGEWSGEDAGDPEPNLFQLYPVDVPDSIFDDEEHEEGSPRWRLRTELMSAQRVGGRVIHWSGGALPRGLPLPVRRGARRHEPGRRRHDVRLRRDGVLGMPLTTARARDRSVTLAALALAACTSSHVALDAAVDGARGDVVARLEVEPMRICVGAGSTATLLIRIERGVGSPASDVEIVADAPDGVDFASPTILATETEVIGTVRTRAGLSPGMYTIVVRAGSATENLAVDVGPGPGALDTSFGGGLASALGVAAPTTTSLLIDANDVVVAHGSALGSTLLRFGETGDVDASFGSAGRVDVAGEVRALARRGSGHILAASTVELVELDATGSALPPIAVGFEVGTPACIAVDRDESVLVGGYIFGCCGYAARIPTAGAISSTRDLSSLYGCALGPDGRLVVGGYMGLWRLSTELRITETLSSETTLAVTMASDGRFATTTADRVLAWLAEGSRDPAIPAHPATAVAIAYERGGSIVALDADGSLLRLRTDRTVEPLVDATPVEVATPSLAVDACGRVVVAGTAPDGAVAVQRFWP